MQTTQMRALPTSISLFCIIHTCQSLNTFTTSTGANGEDIWRSTSDFVPQSSTSYGTIKVGQVIVMEFDFKFTNRSNRYRPGYEENFFRIGHTGNTGGCSEGTRYPSMWLTSRKDNCANTNDCNTGLLDISVTTGSQCDYSHEITNYGNIPFNLWLHIIITIDYNTITLDITGGGQPDYLESWQRDQITLKEHLGSDVPVWFMSDKYQGTGYNIGDATFRNIEIISHTFTYAPSAAPTTTPTAITDHPSTSPSVSTTLDPTFHPSMHPITSSPTEHPTSTVTPTVFPTEHPTTVPSVHPSLDPTASPITQTPTASPIPTAAAPTVSPLSQTPTDGPSTAAPTYHPVTARPTDVPSVSHVQDGEVVEVSTTQSGDHVIDREEEEDKEPTQMDSASIVMIIAVCVVACCVVTGVVILRHKKSKKTKDEGAAKHVAMQMEGPQRFSINVDQMEMKPNIQLSPVYTPEGVVTQNVVEHVEYLSAAQKAELHSRNHGPRTDDPGEYQRDNGDYLSAAQREKPMQNIVQNDDDYLSAAQREELQQQTPAGPSMIDVDYEESHHSSDDDVVGHMTPGMDKSSPPVQWVDLVQPSHVKVRNEGSDTSDAAIENKMTIGEEYVDDEGDEEEEYDVQYDDDEDGDEYEEQMLDEEDDDETMQ
eukprot:449307_1